MPPEWKSTETLHALVSELGLKIGFDVDCNNTMEQFIARCDPDNIDVKGLTLSLACNRESTERLSLLYHIVRAMDEPTLRAMYARARTEFQRGKAA